MVWPRLTFVLGKGGGGKSTVAAALATHLATVRPTVLADLDQRGSAARLLQIGPSRQESVRASERLELCSLSSHRELERFIERIVPMRMISRRMLGSRTFAYVTAALPGLEAFLLLSRLSLMAGEAAREDRYVVVDGLSTGASLELLSVGIGVRNLAGGGTLNRLAVELENFISDSNRFGAAIVVSPQELALREALEAAGRLRERLRVNARVAILNGVPSRLFTRAEAEPAMAADPELARLVHRRLELDDAADRVGRALAAAGLEIIELPMLFSAAMGPAQVVQLSRSFRHKVTG